MLDEEEQKRLWGELKDLAEGHGIEFSDKEWEDIANADDIENRRRDQLALDEEEFAQRRREQQQREGCGCLYRCGCHVVWWAGIFLLVWWAYRTWFWRAAND